MIKDKVYLKKLKENIDPLYMFSDDHQFWKKQNKLHKEYWLLKAKLEGLTVKEAIAQRGDTK